MTNQHDDFKATKRLAAIYSTRMLGLFMILPVISLYTYKIPGATPALIGLALGIYGLTQAIFQIPLGMLSDRFGRKLIIGGGLLVFVIGSMVAAMATTIDGIILGRALQGAGAIGSSILALLSDLTSVENRTKSMAIIGMTIGGSFIIAMILGPIANNAVGLSGIFWLTALLGIVALIVLFYSVPTPPKVVFHRDNEPVPALFKSILTNPNLLRLDLGIFSLHTILTASFIAIPIMLINNGLVESHQWFFFVPVLILAFVCMFPLIIIAEKKRKMKSIFLLAISLVAASQLLLGMFHQSLWIMAILLWVFFTAFTLLEASLPSLISKIAPAGSKGTAMGVYSTAQFLGIFVGGTLGGWLFGLIHTSLFFACAALAAVWLLFAVFMSKPPHLSTLMLAISALNSDQARSLSRQLEAVPGVGEALIQPEEGTIYLKIDKQITSADELKQLRDDYQANLV